MQRTAVISDVLAEYFIVLGKRGQSVQKLTN